MSYDVHELARRSFLREIDPDTFADSRPLMDTAPSVLIQPGIDGVTADLGDAVCTIGAFDGIHQGHRFLFEATIADARRRGLPSVIMTFDPDPDELFLPRSQVRKLLSNEDRLAYLTAFGADYVVSFPFTRDLAAHTTESFLREIVYPVFRPRAIHVGSDFRLGAHNAGNVDELRALGQHRDTSCEVFGYDLVCNDGTPVSATRIRDLLSIEGDCAEATELLCRPHFIRGTVSEGRQKGREFGFPTANVVLDYPYVLPAEGVYACLVLVGTMVYPAAVNIGIPRTFVDEDNCGSIEANLVGFSGDLYGQEVFVSFIERLRGQHAFDTLDELISTVEGNIAWVADNFGQEGFALDR